MKRKGLIAGALILAEIALCGAIVGVFWSGISALNLNRIRWGGVGSDNVSATADEEQTYPAKGPIAINVNKGNEYAYGDVTVVSGTSDQVVVKAHKTAWDFDLARAQADLVELKVITTQTGDTLNVNVQRPDEPVLAVGVIRPGTVDFTIEVPAQTSVYLVTNAGNISVSGLTSTSVLAHSTFGTVTLNDITTGTVDARSNSGEITLKKVSATGSVDLHTDFGGITYTGGSGQSLSADTNSGEVTLQNLTINEDATVKSEFGTITLTDVTAASYDAHSNSGGITLDGAQGKVKLHTEFGDISVTKAKAVTLDLDTNSGTISFEGSLALGPHTVKTEFGSISLALPADSKLDVDLNTDMGRIKSDLPITLSGDQENDHWKGSLNGGGQTLNAKTNSGDITIETLKP
jgi:DUF4097 and DUF4098 domain-containing protein YvlB